MYIEETWGSVSHCRLSERTVYSANGEIQVGIYYDLWTNSQTFMCNNQPIQIVHV